MTGSFRWDWVIGRLDEVWLQLVQHLWLTGLAVGVGFLISFPLAVLAIRRRRFLGPLTAVSGFLYTIPSLALFAVLVPFTGLSVLTAEIGLVGYTLLILIRNIVAGFDAVPEETKEAARGMGYTPFQLLWRVEVPLAVPAIVAGLRIATVTTIGLVTVTALIDLGGLGRFILFGLQRSFDTAIILGAVLSVALALAMDALLLIVEKFVTPWKRPSARATRV